jgi:prepilin-type processing-associated H-X9-DG protein
VDTFRNPDTGEYEIHLPCSSSSRGLATVDASYIYFGYVFDKADCTDPVIDLTPLGAALGASISGDGPEQVAMTIVQALLPLLTANQEGVFTDEDVNLGNSSVNNLPLGNGNTGTVYRLREGIERFLITDINNPAASAVAQSEVWIMGDLISTDVSTYNHIPGGSNVLYMDGHVEFLRYPPGDGCGPAPVNSVLARLAGAITGS